MVLLNGRITSTISGIGPEATRIPSTGGKGSRRYGYLGIALGIFLIAVMLLVFVGSPLSQGGSAADVLNALPTLALGLLLPLAFIVVGIRYVVIGKEFERSAARKQALGTKRRKKRKQA